MLWISRTCLRISCGMSSTQALNQSTQCAWWGYLQFIKATSNERIDFEWTFRFYYLISYSKSCHPTVDGKVMGSTYNINRIIYQISQRWQSLLKNRQMLPPIERFYLYHNYGGGCVPMVSIAPRYALYFGVDKWTKRKAGQVGFIKKNCKFVLCATAVARSVSFIEY